MTKTCPYCQANFDKHAAYAVHIRWNHKETPISPKGREALREAARKGNLRKWGAPKLTHCEKCGSKLSHQERKNKFCSAPDCRFYAHSLGGTASWVDRPKKLEAVRAAWSESFKEQQGKTDHPNQRKYFSSKGERDLRSAIKTKLPQFKWSSGGNHNIGNNVKKAFDIYCLSEKILIEYDGIYHWKDIHGELEKVKQKDRQMEQFCIDNQWTMIRVNEKTYQEVPNIVDTIIRIIENRALLPPVIKLYLVPEYRP